jgi:hypothetical protein
MFVPLAVSETARSFSAFPMKQNGDVKMNRRDQELLDKQMRRLTPPQNEGAIAVMLAAMFLIGITVGSLLSVHQSEPTQIATMGVRG